MAREYMASHGVNEINLDELVEWMLTHHRYQRRPPSEFELCRRDLSRALRSDYFIDKQGRQVRRMHPARSTRPDGSLEVKWAQIFTAPPGHMRISMQQRRQAILADAKQHKLDFDSYNDNNAYGAKLPPFDYDFNQDLEEATLPTTYPEEKP